MKKKPPRIKTKPTPVELMCWNYENWPEDVFPCNEDAGRYLCLEYRDSLILAGALKKLGRQNIVFGQKYINWLHKHASSDLKYEIAPNKPEHAAKRNNGVAHIKEARA